MVVEDTRKMTLEEVDAALARLAQREVALVVVEACYEQQINKLKAEAESRAQPIREEIDSLAAKIRDYVDAHRASFTKPRSRKTPFGQYGLRSVSNVEIEDEELLVEFAGRNPSMGITATKVSVDKKALRTALEVHGDRVPGARISTGEVTFYQVAKSLLDEAKAKALSK